MRVCTQPGCTGRIVDDYCDVCGGPAGAAPFVHARSAASAVSPASAVEAGLPAVGRGSGASARPSGGLMSACAQPGCTGRIVDGYCDVCGSPADAVPFVPATASAASPGFADEPGPAAVPASTISPAPVSDAQGYRTRVEQARLPDDVREAALCEVGKLERTSDQGPESDDIRTWLDTILDLPWSTKITDSMDVQESSEVEAILRRLIEPPVAAARGGRHR